ncbi:MAG: hypothetical protein ACHQNT_10635 [Bacteroidia bacterium]
MKKRILIACAILVAACNSTRPQAPAVVISDKTGWHKIGVRTVDLKKDKDEIPVIGANRFAAVKFKVIDAAIDLQDLEIYYADGSREDIQIYAPLVSGNESHTVDLKGNESDIRKIVFVYKTLRNRNDEKATVEIWGLKTNVPDTTVREVKTKSDVDNKNPEDGELPKPAVIMTDKSGWQMIASTHVDFKKDRDEVIVVGKDLFRQVKLKASDASIELDELIVYFENDNTPQKIPVKSILMEGKETRVMDLEGRDKPIGKIGLTYRTIQNQDKEKAEIQIWGLK